MQERMAQEARGVMAKTLGGGKRGVLAVLTVKVTVKVEVEVKVYGGLGGGGIMGWKGGGRREKGEVEGGRGKGKVEGEGKGGRGKGKGGEMGNEEVEGKGKGKRGNGGRRESVRDGKMGETGMREEHTLCFVDGSTGSNIRDFDGTGAWSGNGRESQSEGGESGDSGGELHFEGF